MNKKKLVWRVYTKGNEHIFELNGGIDCIIMKDSKEYKDNLIRKYEEISNFTTVTKVQVFQLGELK